MPFYDATHCQHGLSTRYSLIERTIVMIIADAAENTTPT